VTPDQFFETKDGAAKAKWLALNADERRAVSFRFFQIVIGPELLSRIKRVPDQSCRNGRVFQRFLMDLDFVVFAFAIPDNCLCLILTDFSVDNNLLPAELRSTAWYH
jgi:hypothetical protein